MGESFEYRYEFDEKLEQSNLPKRCEFGNKLEEEQKIEINLETLFETVSSIENNEHPTYKELLKLIADYIEKGREWDPFVKAQKRRHIISLIAQMFSSAFTHEMNEYLQYLLSATPESPYITYLEPQKKSAQVLSVDVPTTASDSINYRSKITISSVSSELEILPIDWGIIQIGYLKNIYGKDSVKSYIHEFANLDNSSQERFYIEGPGFKGNFRIISINFKDKTIQPLTFTATGAFLGEETIENLEIFLDSVEQISHDRNSSFIYDTMYDLYSKKPAVELLTKKGYKIVTADQGGQIIVKALKKITKERRLC